MRKILTFNIPTKKTPLTIKKLCAKRNTTPTYEKKVYQQKNKKYEIFTGNRNTMDWAIQHLGSF